jgi:hypothetical protein
MLMKKYLSFLAILISQSGILFSQTSALEWVHAFGGTQGDNGQAVATDSQNNVYVAGTFSGTADFDPGTGITYLNAGAGSNVFIQKLSPGGDLIWAKAFPVGGSTVITSIAVDPSDHVILGGRFTGTMVFPTVDSTSTISSPGQADAYMAKMNPGGQFIWTRSFGNPNDTASHSDQINALKTDASGNIYSTGHFYGTADFDPSPMGAVILTATGANMDIFIQKLSPGGDLIWVKKIGAGSSEQSGSMSIHQNTLLLAGFFQQTVDFDPSPSTTSLSSQGYADIFLLSLTTDGDFNHVKQFGSIYSDKGVGVTTDPTGAIYLTGIFDAPIDLDPGTGTHQVTPANGTDFFILKLTPSADFSWAKTFAGTYYKHCRGLAYHPDNGIVVPGIFNDTVDFDPGNPAGSHFSVQDDIFIVYLDSNGNYIWSGSYGNPGILDNDYVTDIAVDNLGGIYSTGWFVETVDFDCGPGVAELTPSGPSDIYIQKLNGNILSLTSHSTDDFKLYPNPASQQLSISAASLNNCRVTICNSLGIIVLEKALSGTEYQLDIQSLSPGSYVVNLTNESGSSHQRVVKSLD